VKITIAFNVFLPEYISEDVFLDIKDKLEDTLSHICEKYNVKQHTKVACDSLNMKWQNIQGT